MSGADGVPGRRRAVPFEESDTLIPDPVEAADTPPVISGAHVRPPLGLEGRIAPTSAGTPAPTPAPTPAAPPRPAARPANRPPTRPAGPVLLPPAERPAARPPGSRRADGPPLVGPSDDSPAGRRIAVEPQVDVPAPTPTPAAKPLAPAEPVVRPAARREPSRRAETRSPSTRPAPSRTTLVVGWTILVALACGGVVLARTSDVPDVIREVSACVLSVALAWALAVRTGGRPIWAAVLTGGLAVGAVASGWDPLVAGASVGTGVLAATLAVMATTPAATFPMAIREVVVATLIAWIGAIAVLGYGHHARPQVDTTRIDYVVLGLSLAGAFALVYRLGAGLHGLGRRGYVVAGTAVVLLAFALAYSEAIAAWGSRDFVNWLNDLRHSTRDALGAVPHPIVAVLGYPALLWGVFMRARRRQGWWVCAFGVAATAPATTRLLDADLNARSVLLGAVYSFVIGIALGYLAIRVEQFLTGSHGRRARRDEEAVAHRPEPRRTSPLH